MNTSGNPEKLKEILEAEDFNKPSKFSCQYEERRRFKGLITWSVKKLDLNGCNFGESKECAFSIGSPDYCKLKMRIFPCGKTESSRKFVSLSICFMSELPRNSWYRCTVSFINKTGEIQKSDVQTESGENVNIIDFDCLTLINKLPEFYVNDKLMVRCAMIIYCNSYYTKSDDAQFLVDDKQVVKAPTKKCFDKMPTDVTFKSKGDDPIPANKAILMCEVPVLRILFKGAPASEKEFKLFNVSASLFKEILNFIYTENVHFSSFSHACEMYDAACFFQIHKLKDICSAYIGGNLSEKNLFVVQAIAQKCHNEELLKACFEFIKTCDSRKLSHSSMLSLDKI